MNETLQTAALRPEDRQRGSFDALHWTDLVSPSLRSEGFAEDLVPAGEEAGAQAPLRRGAASLPLLGAVLAAVLGFAGVTGLGGR